MVGKKRGWIVGVAMVAAAALSACGGEPAAPPQGSIALSDEFKVDFNLVNQDRAPVSNADLKGKTALVYFGYASCPDVCPLALGRMSAALNDLTDAERAHVAPVFITVDPARDTPAKLKTYLSFDPRITGLSGDAAAVEHAMEGFKVYARAQPVADSKAGYEVQHSSLFYLVDPDGSLRFALEDTMEPGDVAEAVRQSLKRGKTL